MRVLLELFDRYFVKYKCAPNITTVISVFFSSFLLLIFYTLGINRIEYFRCRFSIPMESNGEM